MGELSSAMRMLQGDLPTCIQRVNYPIHKGKPNDKHGKYFFVCSIPESCYDFKRGGSKFYDTEQEAIAAAQSAGAKRIQRADCSFV